MKPLLCAAAAVALAGIAAAPAAALPLPGTGLDVSIEATAMTDYRFRGISRSDEDPALQAGATLWHDSGLYTGARGTTLDGFDSFRLRDPQLQDLGDVQLDLYAGYGSDLGAGFSLDAGLMYYVFTGAEGESDYAEPYASISYLLGPAEATVGAKWAPAQDAIGDEAMLYTFAEANVGIPFTPWSFTAHAGRQDWGSFGSYWNWSVGGRYVIGPAQLGLRYVDTDLPDVSGQDAGIVASAGVRF